MPSSTRFLQHLINVSLRRHTLYLMLSTLRIEKGERKRYMQITNSKKETLALPAYPSMMREMYRPEKESTEATHNWSIPPFCCSLRIRRWACKIRAGGEGNTDVRPTLMLIIPTRTSCLCPFFLLFPSRKSQSPESFMLPSMPRFLVASSTVSSRSFKTASSVSTTL